jgi:Cdc6-like AAA superfamily ATPase
LKQFVVDRILERHDICNLKQTANILVKGVMAGRNQVFYGKRNTGKTSLVRSVVFEEFSKKNPKALTLFVDLLAVRSLEDLAQRIVMALGHAFSQKFPSQAKIKTTDRCGYPA